ncbi:MAG: hypothetical protein ACLGIN_00040 [Candidatus Sericytochromatia bacterium]
MAFLRFLAPVVFGLVSVGCAGAPQVSPATPQQQPAQQQQQPAAQPQPAPANVPQGIAVGEPAPDGGRLAGGIQQAAPCIEEFTTLDANGDGYIQADEWMLVRGKTEAGFKAEDTDKDNRIDSIEFCQ